MSKSISQEDLFNAIICYSNEDVFTAATVLKDSRRKHLIVVDSKITPIGVLSSFDIVESIVINEKDSKKVTVEEVMKSNIVTLTLNCSYDEAIEKMVELGTYSLPVVNDNNELIGMVSLDILLHKLRVVDGEY